MKLPAIPFVVLDTETTGFVPKVNRVIEFASMRYADGELNDEYETLISIPTDVPEVIETLTRIYNDDLKGKPEMDEVRSTIEDHIGPDTIIVGQNVGFDIRMLKGEGIDLSDRPWFDTSMLASLVFPELASYSLGYISQVLNLNHAPVHRALGDVRATTELLSKCWERLLELPPELRAPLDSIMQKAPEGYCRLFAALPEPASSNTPNWLIKPSELPLPRLRTEPSDTDFSWLRKTDTDAVQLVEAPLDPQFVQHVINRSVDHDEQTHWIAVKNVHATSRLLDIPNDVRTLQPASALLDTEAVEQFAQQDVFTADEATLAVKLAWYEPDNDQELPIHGDEKAIWKGKLAATPKSAAYLEQFTDLPSVVLLNHWQLLSIAADETNPAYPQLTSQAHVIIDDASMLEDTTTRAYSWQCSIDHLRAAATDHDLLNRIVDLLQIWFERTRGNQEVYYLTKADLTSADAGALRDHINELLNQTVTDQISQQLEQLLKCLDPEQVDSRIAFIETRYDGQQVVESAPARVSEQLEEHLFKRVPTTLLIPPDSAGKMREVITPSLNTTMVTAGKPDLPTDWLEIEPSGEADAIITDPPAGKTVLLVSSRTRIESIYVRFAVSAEQAGVTLICQGLSGGMGRMQAEFARATVPAIWVLTPWSFETAELPPDSVDQLFIEAMPFDHPAHTILSKRSAHYQNSFMDYSLPRVEQRLYRLLRTFARYKTNQSSVIVLDDRLEKKEYGQNVASYLQFITQPAETESSTESDEPPAKTPEGDQPQPSLF